MSVGLQDAAPPLKARILSPRDRPAALAYLRRDPMQNLLLLDLADNAGSPGRRGEGSPQVLVAWRGGEPAGVVSLRPSLVIDADMRGDVLECLLPYLETVGTGLIKSDWEIVSELWRQLAARGRTSLIDRAETAYALRPGEERCVDAPPEVRVRLAMPGDLEALVTAARASLREEGRPDPFEGDPTGFRRWVRGRLSRARVVEADGRVAFVGYADVRRPEGWLIQGVYTWPAWRRRRLAAAGMSALIREAFREGSAHVQLAVVEGNQAAIGLYEGLGFRAFSTLRTILFV